MFDFLLGFFILTCAIIGLSKFTGRYELSTRVKRTTAVIIAIPIIAGVFIGIGWGIAFNSNPRWNNPLLWESMHSKYWIDQDFETDDGIWKLLNGWTWTGVTGGNDYVYRNLGASGNDWYEFYLNFTEATIENQTVFTGKDYMWNRIRFNGYDNAFYPDEDYEFSFRFYAEEEFPINETHSTYENVSVCDIQYNTYSGLFRTVWYDLEGQYHIVQTTTTTRVGINAWAYLIIEFDFVEATLGMYARLLNSAGTPIALLSTEVPPNAQKISFWEIKVRRIAGDVTTQGRVDDIIVWEATWDELGWGWLDGLFLIFKPLFDFLYLIVAGIVNILAWAFATLVNVLVAMLNAVGNALGAGNLGTSILSIGTAIINFLAFVVINIANVFGWVVSLVGTGLAFVVDFLPWLAIIPALIMFDFIFIALRMGKSMSLDPLKDGVEKYMTFGMILFRVFRGIASVLMSFLGFIAGLVPFT